MQLDPKGLEAAREAIATLDRRSCGTWQIARTAITAYLASIQAEPVGEVVAEIDSATYSEKRQSSRNVSVEMVLTVLEPFAAELAELPIGTPDDARYLLEGYRDLGLSEFDVRHLRAARDLRDSLKGRG